MHGLDKPREAGERGLELVPRDREVIVSNPRVERADLCGRARCQAAEVMSADQGMGGVAMPGWIVRMLPIMAPLS